MNAVMEPHTETPKEAAHRLSAPAIADGYLPEALHTYRSTDETPLYWRIRCKRPDTGDKWIRPMHWDGHAYTLSMPTFPNGTPLYGLQRLTTEPEAVVFIVEGESCADALAKLGVVAVTSGSSSSAGKADWSPLQDHPCIVWPDHDEPGMSYATSVLQHVPHARLIDPEVVDALPPKGDVVDWLALHPDATAADVLALDTIAPPTPSDDMARVRLVDASTLKPEPIRWLWPGWLAHGKLHILAGSPGTGKTTIAMTWAANVSAGTPFPTGWKPAHGHVLVWSGEDDPRDTLIPRLLAAGADLKHVHFIEGVDDDGHSRPFDPATDVLELGAQAAKLPNVAMIVVDPIVSAVRGDSHKNAEVRQSLAPLVDLASRLDAVLVGITHFSKGTGGRDPLERVTGSLAFGALARLVFGTCKQECEDGEPQPMTLARAKSNIGPDGGGFAYTFEQTELAGYPGITASRIVWGEAVEGSARDLLAVPDPDDQGDDAGAFLRDLLDKGPMPAKEVYREADNAGFSRDQMKRAKGRIGVETTKEGGGFGGKGAQWMWSLSPTRERGDHKSADKKDRSLVQKPLPCANQGDTEVFDL